MKNEKLESDLDSYLDELDKYFGSVLQQRDYAQYRDETKRSVGFALFVFRRRVLAFFEAVKNSLK